MSSSQKRLVVVGLGMVGLAFVEKILKYDAEARQYAITVIGEEPYLAYNRVGLTSYFENRSIESLYLNPAEWYHEAPEGALNWHINTRVTAIHSAEKTVSCENGDSYAYDVLVLATGSDAILPSVPGADATGVFTYRTVDDLDRMISFAEECRGSNGVVVGGGLLGLEAGKAMLDLGCYQEIRLLERNGWVLSRQLDADAGAMVVEQVRHLGVEVMLRRVLASIKTDEHNRLTGVVLDNGDEFACSTLTFAIGVSPRDDLAKAAGIECAARGGIVVTDGMETSARDVYAVGECASWNGMAYGLIGPGVEMAEVLAFNLTHHGESHEARQFKRPDLSTKLKLLGVNVASFGDCFADRDGPLRVPPSVEKTMANGPNGVVVKGNPSAVQALTYRDPFLNVYKKYIFTRDGKYLLGGMMIGDTKDYVRLVPMVKSMKPLEVPPSELILGANKGNDDDDDGDDLPDDAQVCSCHNVTKGGIAKAVKDGTCSDIAGVKKCTKAGTGCGGCMPLVTTIFNKTMASMGHEVKNYLCAHFDYSRVDVYNIVMVKRLKSLRDVMRECGNDRDSVGCEVCKPAVASIMASLWNRHVMDKTTHGLQDTNDRFLGNIQRDGSYSVVPRMPGGEVTSDQLIAIGEVARKYSLYTKITGGQRIDLFGARKQDLLGIWGELVAAGMESGHAYAKSLRTVKSCVGSTWCRFGLHDSVGMAVRVEERYKSIRAPHKLKGGVSGCVRECAEAQSKDFGLIATEKGFNIFVGGNGGAKPRHADLLAKDVPPEHVIPILDRYLMFYIRTADRLQRTARWIEGLPGGLAYLQDVILRDRLGICASLEAQMGELVDSFFDEWAEAIQTPAIAAKFRQFHNTPDALPTMERELDRGQARPVFWPRDAAAAADFGGLARRWSSTSWQPVIEAAYFDGADQLPNGISATIKRGDTQLAVWRVAGSFYATQQMCPHKRAFVLSDGLVGQEPCGSNKEEKTDDDDELAVTAAAAASSSSSSSSSSPWVSCPHHKRNFDLGSGACRTDPALSIATFEAEARPDGYLHLRLPPAHELDAALGTSRWMVKKGESGDAPLAELDRRIAFVGRRGKKPGVRPLVGASMAKPLELMAAGGGAGAGCGSAPEW